MRAVLQKDDPLSRRLAVDVSLTPAVCTDRTRDAHSQHQYHHPGTSPVRIVGLLVVSSLTFRRTPALVQGPASLVDSLIADQLLSNVSHPTVVTTPGVKTEQE